MTSIIGSRNPNRPLTSSRFIRQSLELNLFFLRIMKEHSFFLEAGFLPKDSGFAQRADAFKNQFNQLLSEAVILANGNVSLAALRSGEFVTDKTLRAEIKTQELSGIAIDTSVTEEELRLQRIEPSINIEVEGLVRLLNQRAIVLTAELVEFKTRILDEMLQCRLFTYNFPLLIDHIRREALLFIRQLERLQRNEVINFNLEIIEQKAFWDRIMAEHALFIAHLLDPTEVVLIDQANNFAELFEGLRRQAEALSTTGGGTIEGLLRRELRATREIRDFKATAEELLLACQIKSLIIPLLADHVLREANHFLRIQEMTGFNPQMDQQLGFSEQIEAQTGMTTTELGVSENQSLERLTFGQVTQFQTEE